MDVRNHKLFSGMVGLLAVPAVSSAASILELQFDVNSITIQAVNQGGTNGFGGVTHTGSLQFGIDSDSDISLHLNGTRQSSFNAGFVGFSGQIDFVNGVSQGGRMTITVLNPDSTTDRYDFIVDKGVTLSRPVGTSAFRSFGYQLDADTSEGLFTDSNADNAFGGVDVAIFKNQQPLTGAFFQLKYRPNASGFSAAADVDIITTAVVPTPATALSGLGLIGLLGAVQWYRRSTRNADDL